MPLQNEYLIKNYFNLRFFFSYLRKKKFYFAYLISGLKEDIEMRGVAQASK